MQKVQIASTNAGKLKELSSYFSQLDIQLVLQPNESVYEVEETGTTFVENAIIKARHSSAISGLPCIADDSGLVVHSIDGQPGVKTARFAHANANSEENMSYLLDLMKSKKNRQAKFVCVLVYIAHAKDPSPLIAYGEWNGEISLNKKGENGFGYDPIFIGEGLDLTSAELLPEQKALYSHRAKAAKLLSKKLGEL